MRYATLDLPLESIHKLAFKAAMATECAGEQGKFWEMHDRLFENQKALEPWSGHAEAIGIDVAQFDACMSSDKYGDAIRKDMSQAQRAGARGTPSFVLAETDPNDPTKVKGIAFIRGAQAFNGFKALIDGALSE
jgi:protein-disulfide isomerase